jgi:hypothetical protein
MVSDPLPIHVLLLGIVPNQLEPSFIVIGKPDDEVYESVTLLAEAVPSFLIAG